MGTPAFAGEALKRLIASSHEVVCVVSQPDRKVGRGRRLESPPVARIAKAAEIPLLQPSRVGTRAFREELLSFAPDVAVVAAFGQIFGPKLLALLPHGCLNVHASLLPRWRGAGPIQAALLAGDGQTGVTIMRMSLGLDEGAMLLAESVAIGPTDTAESLHDTLAALGAELMVRVLDDLSSQMLSGTEQTSALATYAPKLSKGDAHLDWSRAARHLERQVRAMHPWPGTTTVHGGTALKILPPLESVLEETLESVSTEGSVPGQILVCTKTDLLVATGTGAVRITRVQRPGRPPMDVRAFLTGARLKTGVVFGETP